MPASSPVDDQPDADAALRQLARPVLQPWMRWGLCVTALCLFGSGVATSFMTDNGVGSAALTTSGLAVLLLAAVGNHVQSLETAGVKLGIREFVVTREALARQADREGHGERAAKLRQETSEVLQLVGTVSRNYDDLRMTMPPSWERTQRFEDEVRRAKRAPALAPDVLEERFAHGTDGERIFVLGNIQGHPESAVAGVIDEAISSSRSTFEQYHGLKALESSLETLPPADAVHFVEVLSRLLVTDTWPRSSDRRRLATRLVERMTDSASLR